MTGSDILTTIAQELSLGRAQVAATVALFDEGNTMPFCGPLSQGGDRRAG